MVDLKNTTTDQQASLNQALELLHFGYRAFIAGPDQQLEKLGMSRVHHRILYFIGRNPRVSVKDLLAIMKVSKQYLHQPLRRLIQEDYVKVHKDKRDGRVKRLALSGKGRQLEQSLSESQRLLLQACFDAAGPRAEASWKKVMAELVGSSFSNDC